MKLSVALAVSGLLVGAAAQMAGLPDCAQSCANDSIPKECGLNPKCICTSEGFIKSITCCVAEDCSEEDQKKTIEFAKNICRPAGVTDLPESAVCDSEKETDKAVHGTAVSTGAEDSTDGVVHGTAVSTGVAEATDGIVHGTAVSTGAASSKDGKQTMPPNLPTGSATGSASETASGTATGTGSPTGTGADPASATSGAAALVAQSGAVAAAAAIFAIVI